MRCFIAALIALTLSGAYVRSQWGPRGCPPQGAVAPVLHYQPVQYVQQSSRQTFTGWSPHPDKAGQYAYYEADRLIGLYCTERETFWRWDSRSQTWSEPCNPPASPPCPHRPIESFTAQVPPDKDFGMGWRAGGEECYYVNGRKVSRRQAIEAIEAESLTDDSNLRRVTVIGPDADRKQVIDALNTAPELQPFKGQLVVQSYAPDHWAIVDSNFKRDGKPTVYIQSRTGKVLHRQDEWRGAAKFAEALKRSDESVNAVRKADPTYDSSKDPDLNKQVIPPIVPKPDGGGFDWSKIPGGTWVMLGLAVALVFVLLQKGGPVHAAR